MPCRGPGTQSALREYCEWTEWYILSLAHTQLFFVFCFFLHQTLCSCLLAHLLKIRNVFLDSLSPTLHCQLKCPSITNSVSLLALCTPNSKKICFFFLFFFEQRRIYCKGQANKENRWLVLKHLSSLFSNFHEIRNSSVSYRTGTKQAFKIC